MADPITEELALDLDAALQSLATLDDALTQVAQNFRQALAEAVGVLGEIAAPELDTAPLQAELAGAITAAGDTQVVLDDVDAEAVAVAIEDAAASAPPVALDADITGVTDALAGITDETVTIGLEVDTSAALEDQAALQEELGETGAVARDASGGLEALGVTATSAGAAAQIAQGELSGLSRSTSLLGSTAGTAAAGVIAVAAAGAGFAQSSIDAAAATERFDEALGQFADDVNRIDVGNLNVDLSELAVNLGTDDDALRNTAASIVQMAEAADIGTEAAAGQAEAVIALASAAVAANPALGDVATVADAMSGALARGGRFAAEFNIALTPTEIRARAAENALRGLGDGISVQALSLAGSQLAIEKYGNTLDEKIGRGLDNPILQQRSLAAAFSEAVEEIGKPIVIPFLEVLEGGVPVAINFAEIIGSLAQVGLPAIEGFLEVLGGVLVILEPVVAVLELIPDPIFEIGGAVVALNLALRLLTSTAPVAGRALGTAFSPVGIAVVTIGLLITAIDAYGKASNDVAADAEAASSAIFGQAQSLNDLRVALDGVTESFGKYILKTADLGDEQDIITDGIDRLGLSFDELQVILTGTDAGIDALAQRLADASDAGSPLLRFTQEIADELKQEGEALQTAAKEQLAFLQGTGELTQKQVDAAVEQNTLADGTINYFKVVEQLTPALGGAARGLADFRSEFAGTEASIGGFVDAQGLLTSNLFEQNDAWVSLAFSIAQGKTTAEDFTVVATLLGTSVEQVAAFADSVTASIDTFVDTAVARLPEASAAFEDLNDDATVSAQEIAAGFEKIIGDSFVFAATIARLHAEGFDFLATSVAEQGPAAAAAIAELFNDKQSKLPELEALAKGARDSLDNTKGALDELAPDIIIATGKLASDIEAEFRIDFSSATLQGLVDATTALENFDIPPSVGDVGVEMGIAIADGVISGFATTLDLGGAEAREFLAGFGAREQLNVPVPLSPSVTNRGGANADQFGAAGGDTFNFEINNTEKVDPLQLAAEIMRRAGRG